MNVEIERHATAIFDNEHLTVWVEVFISPERTGLGGVHTRTHYLRIEDKTSEVTTEFEFSDNELDEFARKIVMYRYARR